MKSAAEIRDWMVDYLANNLRIERAAIDPSTRLDDYGMQSILAAAMTRDLQDYVGFELPQNIAARHPTIDALAQALADPSLQT
ncbi:acyl carrier protein [Nannocystis punicea]|uniref:Acyl carrier protein n=1 Tax=Nannocystis punicea TaxID=2995304 RepID=A0ABY7GWB6_9BACT|nr:acyl carrier protein [Nannocystis poenicansa]WAS91252.1 acyl carrier protein [Nannocystis poenicansa]